MVVLTPLKVFLSFWKLVFSRSRESSFQPCCWKSEWERESEGVSHLRLTGLAPTVASESWMPTWMTAASERWAFAPDGEESLLRQGRKRGRVPLFRSLHHLLKMFDPDAIPFIFFPAFFRFMHLLIWASHSCLQHLDTIWESKTECQVRKVNKPLKITLSTGVSVRWKTRPALFVFFFSSSDCARRREDKN